MRQRGICVRKASTCTCACAHFYGCVPPRVCVCVCVCAVFYNDSHELCIQRDAFHSISALISPQTTLQRRVSGHLAVNKLKLIDFNSGLHPSVKHTPGSGLNKPPLGAVPPGQPPAHSPGASMGYVAGYDICHTLVPVGKNNKCT